MKNEFFSLDWFKERIENATDEALKEKIGAKIDKVLNELIPEIKNPQEEPEAIPGEPKPVKSAKLVNDSLTVVFRDGTVFSKTAATEDDFKKVVTAQTKEEVLSIVQDKAIAHEKAEQQHEAEKLTVMVEGINLLGTLKDFQLVGSCLYLKGTSRTIPQLLVEKFAEVVGKAQYYTGFGDLEERLAHDDEYQGLKNFFMWCCLNPRAEVADKLYGFLSKNGMKITKQGFFVALRNVVEVTGVDATDNLLVQFLSNAYNKVKAVWKKNPADFRVVKCNNNQFCLEKNNTEATDGTYVGELVDLYLDLPNLTGNRYTDNWTRTFDIRIGQVVSMPKESCNWSTQDCATAGLHFAGHTAPYVLCGDTTVFTLHNPMKVVGIGVEKGRCWEYLPFMTTNVKEADQIMNSRDFDFLQLDEEYAIRELEALEERAKEGFTAESRKYDFNLPSISTAEINSIVLSLNDMKKTIADRISLVK